MLIPHPSSLIPHPSSLTLIPHPSSSHAALVHPTRRAASSLAGLGKITARASLAALVSFLLAVILGPRSIAWLARRFREPIKSDSPEICRLHQAKQATPTMGGLFIVAGLVGQPAAGGRSDQSLSAPGPGCHRRVDAARRDRRPGETSFGKTRHFRPQQTGRPGVDCRRGSLVPVLRPCLRCPTACSCRRR